jgi:gluconate 5-dehydrogenase
MEKFNLTGKRTLVTGGSRGIGLGIATALAEAGADIVLVSRQSKGLEEASDQLSNTNRQISTYPFDMNQTEEIGSFFKKISEETGGIDILVNNAGGTRRGAAESISAEDWQFVINLNLTSVFKMSQEFAKERIKTKQKGKIINIASLMSELVRAGNSPYAASKGGIRQLTKALAVDWAEYGINVNAIGPGYIQTELTKPLWEDEDFDKWVLGKTPMGRWGYPEDLGHTAVFLASPAADFITGQIIYVDGGFVSCF